MVGCLSVFFLLLLLNGVYMWVTGSLFFILMTVYFVTLRYVDNGNVRAREQYWILLESKPYIELMNYCESPELDDYSKREIRAFLDTYSFDQATV